MANVTIILGETGSGKSRSIKSLDPEKTIVLNVNNKPLPYAGSKKDYSKERGNLFYCDNYSKVLSMLKSINEKGEKFETIVLDDFTYIMRNEFFDRALEKGYDKYSELAQHNQMIIKYCQQMKEKFNIYLIMHKEDIVSNSIITTMRVASVGKMLIEKYDPVETVTIVLCAIPKYNDNGSVEYRFCTNRCMENGIIIPAKSPEGLFEDLWIPNDLNYVNEKIKQFYE